MNTKPGILKLVRTTQKPEIDDLTIDILTGNYHLGGTLPTKYDQKVIPIIVTDDTMQVVCIHCS